MTKQNPLLFLTVHSGEESMFYPYAYSDKQGQKNIDKMSKIVNQLNTDIFNSECKVGFAQQVLQYNCPGTCLDYIYDNLDAKYVFGWEIFGQKKQN